MEFQRHDTFQGALDNDRVFCCQNDGISVLDLQETGTVEFYGIYNRDEVDHVVCQLFVKNEEWYHELEEQTQNREWSLGFHNTFVPGDSEVCMVVRESITGGILWYVREPIVEEFRRVAEQGEIEFRMKVSSEWVPGCGCEEFHLSQAHLKLPDYVSEKIDERLDYVGDPFEEHIEDGEPVFD